EAVIRFQPGPIFSGDTNDYWAPENWLNLDNIDLDLGECGPMLVDVPGATPSHLIAALGKDGNAYLVNRDNLGGIKPPVASAHVANSSIIQAAVTYRTEQSSYVAFRVSRSSLRLSGLLRQTHPRSLPIGPPRGTTGLWLALCHLHGWQ